MSAARHQSSTVRRHGEFLKLFLSAGETGIMEVMASFILDYVSPLLLHFIPLSLVCVK